MTTLTAWDLIAIFLLGAITATGNPAFADFGLASIVLPVLLAAGVWILSAGTKPQPERTRDAMCWLAAVYIAFIFLWYEQYKLLGDEGSVALFTTLTDWAGFPGQEKVMRIGVGSCEVIASLFILTPRLQGLGGLGGLALMSGAILFHVATPLGVDPYHDGGILFREACSVWTASLLVIWWRRDQLLALVAFGRRALTS